VSPLNFFEREESILSARDSQLSLQQPPREIADVDDFFSGHRAGTKEHIFKFAPIPRPRVSAQDRLSSSSQSHQGRPMLVRGFLEETAYQRSFRAYCLVNLEEGLALAHDSPVKNCGSGRDGAPCQVADAEVHVAGCRESPDGQCAC
jgi:hypothetical protein